MVTVKKSYIIIETKLREGVTMANTKHFELTWIRDVLSDLKRNYSDHNADILDELISIVTYKLQCLEGKSNEAQHSRA